MKVKNDQTVTVIGAGYVGLSTATLLANCGIKTYVVDIDPKKVATIKSGRSWFYEPGLDELVGKAVKAKKLLPTTDYKAAIPPAKFIFGCVGTPDRADGSSNLDYVFAAFDEAAQLAQNGAIFIQKSTVPVGTGRRVIKAIKKAVPNLKFTYVSNPEFLREGTAITDTLYPDRTVLGGEHRSSLEAVAELYKTIEKNAAAIDSTPPSQPNEGAFIYTTLESAELIKVTANAFLALKISFANSIAKLCDKVGADINEVMDGIGKDRRIGRAFLNAGRGYGGGCFPKDVSGLIAAAAEHDVELEIMTSAVHLNRSMPNHILDKIEPKIGSFKNLPVAVLGLSFKSNTSDTRRSPAIALANLLAERGAQVKAYDPKAIFEGHDRPTDEVERVDSTEEALKGAKVTLVATDWPEFVNYDFAKAQKLMAGKFFVDCMNALDEQAVSAAGITYIGVGRF